MIALMLLQDKLDFGHPFAEGNAYTVRFTLGTVTDTADYDILAFYRYQLSKTVVGLKEPVYIVKNFMNFLFDLAHMFLQGCSFQLFTVMISQKE